MGRRLRPPALWPRFTQYARVESQRPCDRLGRFLERSDLVCAAPARLTKRDKFSICPNAVRASGGTEGRSFHRSAAPAAGGRECKGVSRYPRTGRITYFRFHDLRHTLASSHTMNGGDLYELAKFSRARYKTFGMWWPGTESVPVRA